MAWWYAIPAAIGAFNALTGERKKPKSQFPGSQQLGAEFQKFLLERLRTPAEESDQFLLGSKAIRDALSGISGESRQRLGQQGVQGGFLDSGNLQLTGNVEIDRAELAAFGSSIRDLILGLEDRRTEGILPYLSGGQAAEGQKLGARGQDTQLLASLAGIIANYQPTT